MDQIKSSIINILKFYSILITFLSYSIIPSSLSCDNVLESEGRSHPKYSDSLDKGEISKTLSTLLPKIIRRTDVITQENGNFALMLVETAIEGAKNFSSRLKDEIVKSPIGKDIHIPAELSELLKIEYHSFPEQADYFQKWTTTKV